MKKHIVYSNMTWEEEFKLNGTLCGETIENILQNQHITKDMNTILDTVETHIHEADTCFPSEDCLTDIKSELKKMNVRDENLSILNKVIEMINDAENELYQTGEYGSSELRKAIEQISN